MLRQLKMIAKVFAVILLISCATAIFFFGKACDGINTAIKIVWRE